MSAGVIQSPPPETHDEEGNRSRGRGMRWKTRKAEAHGERCRIVCCTPKRLFKVSHLGHQFRIAILFTVVSLTASALLL